MGGMNGRLGFGKHKDTPLPEVPEQYLRWLLDQQTKLCVTLNTELERREATVEASMSWLERIVVVGYRELSKRHHPDTGGTNAEMKQVNAAYEVLREGLDRSRRRQEEDSK